MAPNHPPTRRWPVRMFRVEDDSMRPALEPGDGLLAIRTARVRPGQLRIFRHPHRSTRWLVKRVGEIYASAYGSVFEALSDDPPAARAGDSRTFGPVPVAGSYRVVWTAKSTSR